MNRSWDDLIADGRDLKIMEERVEAEAGNVRWLWGDLALEVAAIGRAGDHSGSEKRLRRFSDELDVSFESLREYRRVAAQWPNAMRMANQPWSVHQMFASREDREEIIANPVDVRTGERVDRWTFRGAQRFLGNKPSPHYTAPPTSTEEKADLARIFLSEDGVADVVFAEAGEHLANTRNALADIEGDDSASDKPVPATFDAECGRWVNQLNTVFIKGARLAARAEDENVELGAHASIALLIYQRLSERKLDAELRALLEESEL